MPRGSIVGSHPGPALRCRIELLLNQAPGCADARPHVDRARAKSRAPDGARHGQGRCLRRGIGRHRDGGGAVPGCGHIVASVVGFHLVHHRPRQSRADAVHGVQVVRTVTGWERGRVVSRSSSSEGRLVSRYMASSKRFKRLFSKPRLGLDSADGLGMGTGNCSLGGSGGLGAVVGYGSWLGCRPLL